MKPTTNTRGGTKCKLVMKQETELEDPSVTSVKMILCVLVIVLLFKSLYFKKK